MHTNNEVKTMLFKKCYQNISAKDARQMLESGNAMLIDVRERDEHRSGRIPKSTNIPVGHLHSMKKKLPADKQAPIITYCLSGMRAKNACATLANFGYTNLYCLGGIHGWPYGIE